MLQEASILESNAAVAWLDHDQRTNTQNVVTAFIKEIGMLPADVFVVRHYPEAFLVRFFHQHHFTNAVGRHELPFGSTKL